MAASKNIINDILLIFINTIMKNFIKIVNENFLEIINESFGKKIGIFQVVYTNNELCISDEPSFTADSLFDAISSAEKAFGGFKVETKGVKPTDTIYISKNKIRFKVGRL